MSLSSKKKKVCHSHSITLVGPQIGERGCKWEFKKLIEGRQGNKNWTVIACANLAKANLGFLVKQSESGFEISGLSETKQSHSQTVHTHLLGLIMFRQTVPAWYRRHAHKAILHGLSFLQHTQLFLLQILLSYDRTIEPITQRGGPVSQRKAETRRKKRTTLFPSICYIPSFTSPLRFTIHVHFEFFDQNMWLLSLKMFYFKLLLKDFEKKNPTFLFISFCMCVCICIARLCGEDQWQLEL